MYSARVTITIVCLCAVTLANPRPIAGCGLRIAELSLSAPISIRNPQSKIQNPKSPASQPSQREIERARQMIVAGAVDQAIELLRGIAQKEPDNYDAHLLLGMALALAPERSQAIEHFRRAIELRPAFAPAYHTFGTALARLADFDAARQMFEKAVALDPRLTDARISLALLLAQRKEFVAAREHLAQAIKIQKNSPPAAYTHYLLGQIFLEENEPEKALREIEAALRLRLNYAEAHLSRGLAKKKLLEEDEALQSFKKAAELLPNNHEAQYQLGAAYLRAGDSAQAVEHLRKALELRRRDRLTLSQLCRALYGAGKSEESGACQQELKAIIQADLKAADVSVGALNSQGIELEKAGDVAAALEKYRAAVELNPFQPVLRRNFALALCRLGRWEEGIAELREVLRVDPEDTEATKALYIALEKARAAKKTGSTDARPKPNPK
jgi:tetratricopeptide (TPR) repeat protein